jgi:hypothetical protein
MLRLIQYLWSGCWHHWQIIKTIKTTHTEEGRYSHMTEDFILQCSGCGNVKRRNLKP